MDDGYLIQPSFPSTHPVWGGTCQLSAESLRTLFQSTHPVWGGTVVLIPSAEAYCISIHPPRVGWDFFASIIQKLEYNFNPPTPCGVGPGSITVKNDSTGFQSTHPVWGGTFTGRICGNGRRYFNPPTPCGVGLVTVALTASSSKFQSTHPVWGGTFYRTYMWQRAATFQSTHPVWGGTHSEHLPDF